MRASRDCIAASTSTVKLLPPYSLHAHRNGKFPGPRLRAAAAAAAATLSEQQQQHSVPQQPYPATAHLSRNLSALTRQQQHQQQQDVQRQQQQQLPKHVAIIMDGNSRWAAARGLPAWVGHERGVAALRAAVIAAQEWGIPALTVYAFSLENWQRDRSEVTFLMELFRSALQQQLPELQRSGVRLQFMGQLDLLPPALQQQIADCTAATAGNSGLLLNVAVSYSSQHDMVAAVQRLAEQVQAGTLAPGQITAALISQQLASAAITAAVGPPDLLIRTSGEQRLSNFMLFEAAYTELCFLDCMWPDFDKQQFEAALQQYAQRQRRFGKRNK